jgi:hypothetical protein
VIGITAEIPVARYRSGQAMRSPWPFNEQQEFIMRVIGKMLSLTLLAGLAAPTLAQAQPSSFWSPSPRLIMRINKAYKTNFAPPAQRQASNDTWHQAGQTR